MQRILITGGAGYIGSILVPILLENHYFVTVLDKMIFGVSSLLSVNHHENLSIITGDILDEETLASVINQADVILHLAAIVGYPACDAQPELAWNTNVEGTRNIVKLMKSNQKLIFASTGSCYGDIGEVCTEELPINPISLYGRTKAEGEKLVLSAGGVVLRFSTLFGVAPRLRTDLLVNNFMVKAILNKKLEIYEGHFKRSFTHVCDAATSLLFSIHQYKIMRQNIYNVGNQDLNMSKKDLGIAICTFMGDCKLLVTDKYNDPDKRDYTVSFEKLENIGFKCNIGLAEGLKELWMAFSCLSEDELKCL